MTTTATKKTSSSKTQKPNPSPSPKQQPPESTFYAPLRRKRAHRKRMSISTFLGFSSKKKCVSQESKSNMSNDSKQESLPEQESIAERHRRTMSKIKAQSTKNAFRTPKPSVYTPDSNWIAKEESKGIAEIKEITEFKAREKKIKDNERKLREEISALKSELQRLKKEASLDNALIVKEYAKLRKDQERHKKNVESLELKQQEMSARLRDFCSFQQQQERLLEVKRNDVKKMKIKTEKLQRKLRIETQKLEEKWKSFKCEKESFEEEREKIRANMEILSKIGVDSIGDSFLSTLAKRRLKTFERQPSQREADKIQLYRQQTHLSGELENVKNQQRQILSEHHMNVKARAQLADAKRKLENHAKLLLDEQSKTSTKVKEQLEKLQKDRENLREKVAKIEQEREELLMRQSAFYVEVEREKNKLNKGFEELRKEQKEWKSKRAAERYNTTTKEKRSQSDIVELLQHHSFIIKKSPQCLFDRAEEKFAEVQKNEQLAVKQHNDVGVAQQIQEHITTADFVDKNNNLEEDIDELVQHIKRLRSGN